MHIFNSGNVGTSKSLQRTIKREAFDDERMEHVTSKFRMKKKKKRERRKRRSRERERETKWKKNYTTVIARLS